jgi:hypothetical protein
MSDEIFTKLDHLLPMDKLTDPKDRVIHQETPKGKRRKKHEQEFTPDVQPGEEEEKEDPSKDPNCGKILDIVI